MSVRLAFEAMGDGPPLVILHGLFGSGRNWVPVAKALASDYRIYLPDARNHGASPWSEIMSYTEMAQDVLDLMERQQLQRPVVIGHSMGGKTAMALALEHPQAITGVAVIDIAPEIYADQFSPYITAMRGLDLAASTSRREIRQALATRMDAGAPIDFLIQSLQRQDERFDWRLNLLATALCMKDLCGFPKQLVSQRFQGPALFAAGADSDYVQAASHAGITRLFPDSRLDYIADAGHWVHADQPQALLQILRDWPGQALQPAATPPS